MPGWLVRLLCEKEGGRHVSGMSHGGSARSGRLRLGERPGSARGEGPSRREPRESAPGIWEAEASLGRVTDCLDVVAVEVDHEGGVVARMVLRPQTGRAVVSTARAERGLVEGAHLGAALDRKGDVHGRRG